MKSTYKLIGASWDGLPVWEGELSETPLGIEVAELGTPPNLFDTLRVKRYVRLSKLLSLDSLDEVAGHLNDAGHCDELIVAIDYRPKALGRIPQRFYDLRIRQTLRFVCTLLPGVRVSTASAAEPEGLRALMQTPVYDEVLCAA